VGLEQLETDGHGNVVTRPMVGFITMPVAGTAVICQIRYVTSEQEFISGVHQKLQLVMSPTQAQELAESLRNQAERLLNPEPNETVQ
jgi:hypothetical protein